MAGSSPVRRHWHARQRGVSIPEGGRGDTGRGLRDAYRIVNYLRAKREVRFLGRSPVLAQVHHRPNRNKQSKF